MVKLNVHTDDNKGYVAPDLFRAARNDDIIELAAAIQDGQSLDEIEDEQARLTPVHIACIHKSENFLRAIKHHKFDPWIRDANLRTPMDHARAQELRDAMKMLFDKMYPPGFENDRVVELK